MNTFVAVPNQSTCFLWTIHQYIHFGLKIYLACGGCLAAGCWRTYLDL